jgi:hypothetical protein
MEDSDQRGEIEALIKPIHEDRQTAKDKERRDAWTKYVSLMVVALAVVTADAILKAGSDRSRVLLHQAKASDDWASFQAKSIKRFLAEMESRLGPPAAQAEAKRRAERYQREQDEIQRTAKAHEGDRDEAASARTTRVWAPSQGAHHHRPSPPPASDKETVRSRMLVGEPILVNDAG